MADWEGLRELAQDVVPPDFDGLARTARRRQRRARVAIGAVAVLALVGGGVGHAALDQRDTGSVQPAKDPTTSTSESPDPVRALPDPDMGEDFATLGSGRYRVPLGGGLAFDIRVPDGSYAHDGGRYIAHGSVVVKIELAGDRYGVPADACRDHQIVPAGPGVDALVQAMLSLPPYQVSAPRADRIGGVDGVVLEVSLPASYDATGCDSEGTVQLPGNPGTAVSSPPPYVGRWWVLEVAGQRVVVQQNCWECRAGEFDDAQVITDSVTFTTTQ